MGNSYVYGAIICDTMEEAFAIKVGKILDVEKVKFSRRISNLHHMYFNIRGDAFNLLHLIKIFGISLYNILVMIMNIFS
jgi:hypothetical protein